MVAATWTQGCVRCHNHTNRTGAYEAAIYWWCGRCEQQGTAGPNEPTGPHAARAKERATREGGASQAPRRREASGAPGPADQPVMQSYGEKLR